MTPKEVSTALRYLADAVDKVPDGYWLGMSATVNAPANNLEHMVALARTVGGKWDKSSDGGDFGNIRLTLNVSNEAALAVFMSQRLVCKKVVTRTIVPATEEYVIHAKPETVKEVVTWECPESLLEMSHREVTHE